MQRLFKYHFYSIILLTAVLFMVDTAIGDDHTDIPTQEIQQTTQKPTIIILGSTHLEESDVDLYSVKLDDVLSPKRQREIEQLVTQLKAYQPTKIALEVEVGNLFVKRNT